MKRPHACILSLRARVADQIEELSGVMTHLREAAEWCRRNPKGAAIDLADAGTVLLAMHDAFGALSKAAFDIKTAIEK